MTDDAPERIWAALEEVGEAETSFEATYFGKCSDGYAGMSYATEYIRKDVSDALVAADRESCARIAAEWEETHDRNGNNNMAHGAGLVFRDIIKQLEGAGK